MTEEIISACAVLQQAISAIDAVLLPGGEAQQVAFSFSNTASVLGWIQNSIVDTVWEDPLCGDDTCFEPFEFPAFGRFGCAADCGNASTTAHALTVQALFAAPPAAWMFCASRRQHG